MSDASTRYMMQRYSDEAPVPRFLTSLFSNQVFFDTEEVELDIERDTDDIAVAIQDLSVEARSNESGKFTSKSFKPPIFKEKSPLSVFDLIKRSPGQSPFENPDFAANAVRKTFDAAKKLQNKVGRSIELQASQILTNDGVITLIDEAGVAVYTLDFQPKTTHFVTPTAWAANGASGAPLTDLPALAQVLRRDGRKNPKRLIFGGGAWTRFMVNAEVQKQLASVGHQRLFALERPKLNVDEGATFMGYFAIGAYDFELWIYDAVYKHPQTGVSTAYIPDNKVVMVSPGADMRIAYGAIPRVVPPDPRVEQFVPSSLRGPGYGLSNYAWVDPEGTHVNISVGSRPLVIPTAIDTYGCLTVF